jgi:hypothetical protein
LPEEVQQMVSQAHVPTQVVDQHFDTFINVIRYLTGDKHLGPPQEGTLQIHARAIENNPTTI